MATYVQNTNIDDFNGLRVIQTIIVSDDWAEGLWQTDTLGNSVYYTNGMINTPTLTVTGTYTGDVASTYTVEITAVTTENCTFSDNGDGMTRITITGGTTTATTGGTIWFEPLGGAYSGYYEVISISAGLDYLVIDQAYTASGGSSFRHILLKWRKDAGSWNTDEQLTSAGTLLLELGITIALDYGDLNVANPSGVYDIWKLGTTVTIDSVIIQHDDLVEEDEDESGILTMDEQKLILNETAAATTTEMDLIDFITEATDTTIKRYFAMFLRLSTEALDLTTQQKYVGIIKPEMSAEVTQYQERNNWTTAPDPLHTWSVTVAPFFETVFDSISLYDICERVNDDTVWVAANVENRVGHFGWTLWHCEFEKLVNLNVAFKRMGEALIEIIQENGYGTFNITWNSSYIDGDFMPTRYNYVHKNNGTILPHVDAKVDNGTTANFTKAYPNEGAIISDTFDDTDIRSLQIGDETDDETSPFISYRLLWHVWTSLTGTDLDEYNLDHVHIDPAAAEGNCWYNMDGIETFTDLLFKICKLFGLIPVLTFTSSTTLDIAFKRKRDLGTEQVYIISATADSLDTEPMSVEEKIPYGPGYAFSKAREPIRVFPKYNTTDGFILPSNYQMDQDYRTSEKEMKLINLDGYKELETPLTLSPTLCYQNFITNSGSLNVTGGITDVSNGYPIYPHNAVIYYNPTGTYITTSSPYSTFNVHTAIYMKVSPYDLLIDGEPNVDYWTPAKGWIIRRTANIIDDTFYNIAEAVNFFQTERINNYTTDREINIPCLSQFSLNSDGSDPGPNIVKKGQKLVLGANSYLIRKINTTNQYEVALTLALLSEYAYSDPLLDSDPINLQADYKEPSSDATIKERIAKGAIEAGNWVSEVAATATAAPMVETSQAQTGHFGRLAGIALNNAGDGESVKYMTYGTWEYSGYNFTSGARVYLRSASSGINLSEEPIETAGLESLFADLCYAVDETILKIDIQEISIQ